MKRSEVINQVKGAVSKVGRKNITGLSLLTILSDAGINEGNMPELSAEIKNRCGDMVLSFGPGSAIGDIVTQVCDSVVTGEDSVAEQDE